MPPAFPDQPINANNLCLHVVQADYGDCLVLQFDAEGVAKYILVDGGPDGVYASHLKIKLEEIAAQKGRLDLVVLTHVDEDHVVGLVDMLSAIAQARNRGETPLIEVGALWYNTFRPIESGAFGTTGLVETFGAYLSSAFAGGAMQRAAYSITQGEDLWKAAHILNIPLNSNFTGRVVAPENAPQRPQTPPAFPAVHDRPPQRSSTILSGSEQKRLEDELAAERGKAAAGTARNP